MRGAGGQRPGPPQVLGTDAHGGGVVQGGAGVTQRGGGLAERGGGERLRDRDDRLLLGVVAGPQVTQSGQDRLGGGGIAAQRYRQGPIAGQVLDAGEAVSVGGLGQLGFGGVPVAGHQQRLGQVSDRGRELAAGAGLAQLGGGGTGGLGTGGGVGAGQRVGQIEQRAAELEGVAGLPG